MHFGQIKRREFFSLLGGAAAWPLAARGQQPVLPVVGFLRRTAADSSAHLLEAFRRGLAEAGFVEGQNLTIDYRWADDQVDRLAALTADLVRRQAAVIVHPTASGCGCQDGHGRQRRWCSWWAAIRSGPASCQALNRPGGNVTGVYLHHYRSGGQAAWASARAGSQS